MSAFSDGNSLLHKGQAVESAPASCHNEMELPTYGQGWYAQALKGQRRLIGALQAHESPAPGLLLPRSLTPFWPVGILRLLSPFVFFTTSALGGVLCRSWLT